MERGKLYAKAVSKYTNKWLALVDYKVVASGNTLQEVKEAVEKKKSRIMSFTWFLLRFYSRHNAIPLRYAIHWLWI